MDTMWCLIGFFTLLVTRGSFGSSSDGKLQITSADVFGAAYAEGYKQIVAARLSPRCKEKALNDLAAAHEADSAMNCSGFLENVEDIGQIMETALDSVGQLVMDMNTVINSVPLCWDGKAWFNFPGKIACVFSQFRDVWDAFKDFWNYENYVMDTANVIKAYVKCLEAGKKKVSKNVQVIVETAKLCN